MKKVPIHGLSDRILILNLYATQGIVLVLACLLLWWQGRFSFDLWRVESWTIWLWGIAFGWCIVFLNLIMTHLFPAWMTDDSGINEKLFRKRPVWHIFVMTLVVAFSEEMLFRGALQPVIGIFWTSVVFTLIHFRYLKQWLMTAFVFVISLGFGGLVVVTHSIVAPMVAHFVVDFTLGLSLRLGYLDHFTRL